MTYQAAADDPHILTSPGAMAARSAPALPDRKSMVLRLDRDGMFWNVNKVINSVYVAKSFQRDFFIRWKDSLYFEGNGRQKNTWQSYFHQPFPDCKRGPQPELFEEVFNERIIRKNQITRSRMSAGENILGLGLPINREDANNVIRQHIVLKPRIKKMVDRFIADYLEGPVVGLHIRGLGRDTGATFELRHFLGDQKSLPFRTYFKAVDEALERFPTARVFACSDSGDVIQTCHERYGDRLVTFNAIRTAFGEMHSIVGQGENSGMSPYQLGLDVIIEAYALSSCDYFVHGNSNVSNFVLCNAPQMPHNYIFAEAQKAYVAWSQNDAKNGDAQNEMNMAKHRHTKKSPGSRQRTYSELLKERT